MKKYVVFILIILSVQCFALPNNKVLRRESRMIDDDDYDDGMHFKKTGKADDEDFIANASSCPQGMVRAPWGACIACTEYQKKFGVIGPNC